MANLTITVDSETLRRARVRAIERGESVNQYLAEQLRRYATPNEAEQRRRLTNKRLADLATRIKTGSGGRRWRRDELYAQRITKPNA